MAVKQGVVVMAVWTILLSNLRKKKGSFISICIFVFIIAAALSTILNTSKCAEARFKEANINSDSPELINMMPRNLYDEDMNKKISNAKEVKKIESLDTLVYRGVKIGNTEDDKTKLLSVYEPQKHSFELENGNKMNEIKKGEIYLPFYFKDKCGCKIGTVINFPAGGKNYSFKVADFFEDPFYGSYMVGTKRILLNKEDFDTLRNTKGSEFKDQIVVGTFFKDQYKGRKLDESIYNLNKEVKIAKYGTDYDTISIFKDYILSFANIISSILIGFCVLLFIIVIIILAHSIISNIDMEYVSIGVLKAMGFSNLQLRLSLMFEYALAALISSLLGIVVSAFVLEPVGNLIMTDTNLLWKGSVDIRLALEIAVVIVAVVCIFTLISTRRISKITPVRAIALGHAPVYFSSRLNFSLDKFEKLPLSIKLSLKQIITHVKQYFSLLIVTTLLVSFMVSISSIKNAFNEENTAKMFDNFPQDINIVYKDNKDEDEVKEIFKYINSEGNIVLNYRENGVYRIADDNNILVNVISRGDVIGETIEGRNPKYDNEVLITKTSGRILQKGIGDNIIVEDFEKHKREYIIVGLNQCLYDNGKNITMLQSGMLKLDSSFENNSINITIKNKDKLSSIVSELKKKHNKKSIVITDAVAAERKSMKPLNDAVSLGTGGIYIVSAIVCGIICLLLCTKTLQREEMDIGILKAEGFTDTQLKFQFVLRFVLISIIGSVLGLLFNMLTNNTLMSLLLANVGINKYRALYSADVIMLPIVSVCVFICLFSYLVSVKIKRITPKNLIRE